MQRLAAITGVLRANYPWASATWWTPLSTPIRYRLRHRSQSAEGAHPIQVSAPCPLVVDRAKRPLRLATSFLMITHADFGPGLLKIPLTIAPAGWLAFRAKLSSRMIARRAGLLGKLSTANAPIHPQEKQPGRGLGVITSSAQPQGSSTSGPCYVLS